MTSMAPLTDEARDRMFAAIAEHEAEERSATLVSFTQRDAWELGARVVRKCLEESHPVTIDIRCRSQILFHAALPGARPDQDFWIAKKAALAERMAESSALVTLRMRARGLDPVAMGWLPTDRYALAGGAFPLRVVSAGLVAVLSASGLSSDEDHRLVADAVSQLAVEQSDRDVRGSTERASA
ncbi:heme-binding protein [Microbacterium aoyamense]|uniref:Heme-binding protein n=1 Tax=Microbacterium aoyamense TaxID=344166 RepID=A0ABP5AMA8_9MICO|nr:heme-binding protein [Microbacterium aoyamense]